MNPKIITKLFVVVVLILCLLETSNEQNENSITIGAILPYTNYKSRVREFHNKLKNTIAEFGKSRHSKFNFPKILGTPVFVTDSWTVSPSPKAILDSLCNVFLPKQVAALLYVTDSKVDEVSTRYFLQLVNYLGIPVITWNAINSGLEKELPNSVILQLAPCLSHQAFAMMKILIRYKWNQFSILTTEISGHDEFVQIIKEAITSEEDYLRLTLLTKVKITSTDRQEVSAALKTLLGLESRILLLHASTQDAEIIFQVAKDMQLDFMWIVTQSVVGSINPRQLHLHFPAGLLGIHFDISDGGILNYYVNVTSILGHGLELFVNDPKNSNVSLQSNLTCDMENQAAWKEGIHLYKYLRNVSFSTRPSTFTRLSETVNFEPDGRLKYSTLEIVNMNGDHRWQKVGVWQNGNLHINDVMWPDKSSFPPQGRPEKYHLRVTFLEEPAYLNLESPDKATNKCPYEGVRCRIPAEKLGKDPNEVARNETYYMCCSGFCIDLLKKLSNDLNFTFELKRVEDYIWGSRQENGTWNGLIAELLDHRADMVMTSLKINKEREEAIDFSLPFRETGIAVVVAKRTGIISPGAFLEPFDPISWFFIIVICLQAAALSIFFFEWLSPDGFDKKFQQRRGHNFSLFQTFWLVWATFFAASVNLTCPRGYTARFMANVWAGFTVVFLAIYTANLAAVMITREEYYQLIGVEDVRLTNPFSQKPPLKFGTLPNGNTESILKSKFTSMYCYMKKFNKPTVKEGVKAVKTRELDAFIYDSTVLDYLVGKDDECRLLTVGSWYAKTGYGIAFPPKSKYIERVNQQLLLYREYGHLEQWQKFWFAGACKPTKRENDQLQGLAYVPVTLKQFTSAFVLLGCGILLAGFVFGMENFYFKYLRKPLAKSRNDGCFALISVNLGRSLTFHDAVYKAQDIYKTHKCKDPKCDMVLWKTRRELDLAKMKLNLLERVN